MLEEGAAGLRPAGQPDSRPLRRGEPACRPAAKRPAEVSARGPRAVTPANSPSHGTIRAAHHGHVGGDVAGMFLHGERIGAQHREVGELAGLERALLGRPPSGHRGVARSCPP
jgi:hypothetical protein